MKKFLRFSFWLIFIIGVLLLGLAFLEPRDVTVTRTVVIQAPAKVVFDNVVDFTRWPAWNAMFRTDSAAKINYSGTMGQPGSILAWIGDDGKIGAGLIRNEGVEGTMMRYTFTVSRPAEMLADGYISAKDSGLYTIVTWTFHKHFEFLANATLVVLDLDRYIGGDLENSLANLKTYIEQYAEPIVDIKEVDHPGYMVAGIRDSMQWADFTSFFGDAYSLFLHTPDSSITGPHVGIYYQWDTLRHRADVMAGVVTGNTLVPVNGIIFSQLPPSRAYMAVHKGGYGSLRHAHDALMRYEAVMGRTHWLVVEEYPTYPGNEPDSNKWVTNIYYLLQ
ncbi:hypothetical protein GCM10023093_22630 [Nemorincola caseinilytica]|uniref:AraC effector-binding domain-containing protein n=1 Tax=Nemorincola caseinilytica TaxID=2054315 RepID=A0ABP8NKT0_9BACT